MCSYFNPQENINQHLYKFIFYVIFIGTYNIESLKMRTLAEKLKSEQSKYLIKLIGYFGSQARCAAYLDVSPQVVQGWILRGKISAKMALQAQIVTGNFVTREQLRPDVLNWGEE
jgi:DNA-binding transcriptional regulator YdaS (Cro superfamily)